VRVSARAGASVRACRMAERACMCECAKSPCVQTCVSCLLARMKVRACAHVCTNLCAHARKRTLTQFKSNLARTDGHAHACARAAGCARHEASDDTTARAVGAPWPRSQVVGARIGAVAHRLVSEVSTESDAGTVPPIALLDKRLQSPPPTADTRARPKRQAMVRGYI
jgi:hypothetical protein